MAQLFEDTHPEIEAILIARLREMPAWRKLQLMGSLNRMAKGLALGGLRARHPGASETELRRRLADLLLGTTLAEKVYGPVRETDDG